MRKKAISYKNKGTTTFKNELTSRSTKKWNRIKYI